MMMVKQGLLGVFLLVLSVNANVVPQSNIDVKQLAGKWHMVGFGTPGELKKNPFIGTYILSPLITGDIQIHFSTPLDEKSCVTHDFMIKPTTSAGVYINPRTNSTHTVLDVKYDSHFIFHTARFTDEVTSVYTELYTRETDVSTAIVQKFYEISAGFGIPSSNVVVKTDLEDCD